MFSKGILRSLSREEMSKDSDLKEILDMVDQLPKEPIMEPATFHLKKGHSVIPNSAGGNDFLVCKECCKEVYDDRENPIAD